MYIFRVKQGQHAKALREHPEDYRRCPKCNDLQLKHTHKCDNCDAELEWIE